ncbi:hypothetical protein HG530_010631 [Fusarium avenaceum]|nr:hypothetical protein HG530_010631 [Fusarium avenaceum]
MLKVNRKLFDLAFSYPCLMHASLAVAFTYDRYLNSSSNSRPSLEECYHWSQSTTLFNKRLREPVKTKDKDPIWGTAAALAVLTFSCPDAHRPEDSWPLKASGEDDLDWVYMINGKMSLWDMVDPLRPDSLFNVMAVTLAQMHSPLPEVGIHGIPEALAMVCLLDDSSTPDNNPYFHAAHAVSRILNLADSDVTTGHTQLFTHRLDGAFKKLLVGRDPVALALLYLWYCKAGRSIWWVELRARVECPAIRMYLELYHPDYFAWHTSKRLLSGGATNNGLCYGFTDSTVGDANRDRSTEGEKTRNRVHPSHSTYYKDSLAASFRSRKKARTQLAHTKAWALGGKSASLQRRTVRNRATIHEYVEPDQTTQSSGCIWHILKQTRRGFGSLLPTLYQGTKDGQAADESQHLALRESWSCLALAGIAKHSTIHQAQS